MSSTPDVGQDIDAYCSSCKLVLAHTIIAKVGDLPKRVKCNTCNKEHVYRSAAKKSATKRSSTTKSSAAKKKPSTRAISSHFDTLLDGRSVEEALAYSPKMQLQLSDLINHPSFGLGVVSQVKSSGKVEVVFPEVVKVLIYGR